MIQLLLVELQCISIIKSMKDKVLHLFRRMTFDFLPFRQKKSILVLMFHQVNNDKALFYPAVPVHVFKEMCEFVQKYYEVLHFSEIDTYFSKPNKKPAAVITFDDGHYDILANAFPILKELGLKFNVNIDTEILETAKPQDFVRVYDILNQTKIDSFENRKFMKEVVQIDMQRPINTESVFTALLSELPKDKRREFVVEMGEITGMKDADYSKMLSQSDLKELNKSGLVEFGSHSHSHAILTKLTRDDLEFELTHSKSVLEGIIEKEIDVIAYPNGKVNDEIEVLSKSLGYRFLLKTEDRINKVKNNGLGQGFYRVNQYHQSTNMALAHTYGLQKIIKNMLKK